MRFLKADRLFDGKHFLADDLVLVLDRGNEFKDLVPEKDLEKGIIERFEGILSPGFVNAHCHLELSHLHNKISKHSGLPEFGKSVIQLRDQFRKEEIAEHMEEADAAMWRSGIVVVGDISNDATSFRQKTRGSIFYHTFLELIGLNPQRSRSVFEKGESLLETLKNMELRSSAVPHAPYSTSTDLISLCAEFDDTHNLPFSIHNQESEEENKFFEGKHSKFEKLYEFLHLDISWFKSTGGSSLEAYASHLSKRPSLLVHNTFTREKDLASVRDKNVYWCFCPGANQYIENSLPDFTLFAKQKGKICVGTDSLASNTQLDLIQEVNVILRSGSVFSEEDLLAAITGNAAEALMLEDQFGNFIAGKNTGLNLVSRKNSELKFIKKIA
ncbi:MAG: amidohydrolase family protein [bacterium]|nr:amidohydrolase family protein [bacterium]